LGLKDATEAMLNMAGVQPGMTVLDVACGAGSASLQAAERVGNGGKVVSSDISSTMLDHVRENAERLGVANIETLECAAEELNAGPGTFDAAICRLGLMLFPEPVNSGTAIRHTLKFGARFAPLVFTTPPNNPFMSGSMQILLHHAGKAPPPPGGPGIFALGAPGTLQAALEKSGFTEVSCKVFPVRLALASANEALEMMRGAFGNYRTVVADLGEDERNTAWSEVGDFLRQYENDAGWQTDLEVVIGCGVA
jgi:SAM-dependent methyltransferase